MVETALVIVKEIVQVAVDLTVMEYVIRNAVQLNVRQIVTMRVPLRV